jgi:hypothetical protein
VLVDGVMVMSIAFFAKGFGNIDWCILRDVTNWASQAEFSTSWQHCLYRHAAVHRFTSF